jgi:hypothetical protein
MLFFPIIARAQAPCPVPAPTTIPPPNLSAPAATLVPADACVPTTVPGNGNPIAYFDDYSWRTFIALVWPALKGQRGVPDPNQPLMATGVSLVFETYKADWETFQPNGAAPTEWNDSSFGAAPCPKAQPGDFVLSSFSKFGNVGQAGVGDLVAVLIAQNGTFVRYLAAYNQEEFNKIRLNKWYLAANLPDNQQPRGNPIMFDPGSIDIKSSWIEITKNTPHQERYYIRDAWLLDPVSGTCSASKVGLVGLHIVQKTPTRPQWIWSTFEQIDNVPPPNYVPPQPPAKPTQTFAFNDGTATQMPSSLPAAYVWSTAIQSPPPPINIQRLMPINDDTSVSRNTVATNALWQQALAQQNSVWQFYQLTMTQWPVAVPPNPSLPGTPGNTFPGASPTSAFANTTLETWDQTNIRRGCMSCHNETKTNDFLWSLAMNAFQAPAPASALAKAETTRLRPSGPLEALRNLLQNQFNPQR